MPPLRVYEQILHSQKLIVGHYKILVWNFSSFAVLRSWALTVDEFWIWKRQRKVRLPFKGADFRCTWARRRTFFLHLALHIRVINDFAQGNAAEQGAEETLLPAAAVGTVEKGHAEVTGEVSPLSKHWVLHTTRVEETLSQTRNGDEFR